MNIMYGADADELERLAADFRRAADDLDGDGGALTGLLNNISWLGDTAGRFLDNWTGVQLPRIGLSTQFLRDTAALLQHQAAHQRAASDATGASQGGHFSGRSTGRADVIEAFWATGDGQRAAFDEIEIRQLDNGRYVVVLPGVVDLTDHLDELPAAFRRGDVTAPFYDGQQPDTSRRMEYGIAEATDRSDSFDNPYSSTVVEAMRRAGVPEGADVMLIGHSFGAYTAMELAGDPTFNTSNPSASGYHVNVTHVMAAGGDVNWKFPEIPPRTSALVLNNRYDPVFQAEDGLVRDVAPRYDNHLNIEFQGGMPLTFGDVQAGHKPDGYVAFLEQADDRPELNSWLDNAGAMYGGGGTAYAVNVSDPLNSRYGGW
jgi:pimeloyl-ACP methyl ester carboxylesterase